MRAVVLAVVAARCAALRAGPTASTGESAPPAIAACESTLDALRAAAARADGDAYFECFAADAVFLGTAPEERWPRAEFERYARARFARGDGWTYALAGGRATAATPARHVTVGPGGGIAWFDEALDGKVLGPTRGTGVLVDDGAAAGGWRLAAYGAPDLQSAHFLLQGIEQYFGAEAAEKLALMRKSTNPFPYKETDS